MSNINLKPSPKLCTNCKHFCPSTTYLSNSLNIKYGTCKHPSTKQVNIISGNITYPDVESSRYNGPCKPEALLYEQQYNPLTKLFNHYPVIFNSVYMMIYFFVFIFVFINTQRTHI